MPSFAKRKDAGSPPSPTRSTASLSSTRRRTSQPQLSSRLGLLFAQPAAPLAPTVSGSHSTSVSSTCSSTGSYGSSLSEEALARQLDRDAGGDKMGLRSRRSSGATIRTMRTIGRQGSEEAVLEEAEGSIQVQEPEAGPSRLPFPDVEDNAVLVDITGKGKGRASDSPPRINPKKSMTWQRWNHSPSFPKASAVCPSTVQPSVPTRPDPDPAIALDVVDGGPRPSHHIGPRETDPPPHELVHTTTAPKQPQDNPPSISPPPHELVHTITAPKQPQDNPPLANKPWWFKSRGKDSHADSTPQSAPVIVEIEGLNATTIDPIPQAPPPAVNDAPTRDCTTQAEGDNAHQAVVDAATIPGPPEAPPTVPLAPLPATDRESSPKSSIRSKAPRTDSLQSTDRHEASPSEPVPSKTITNQATGGSRWYSYLGFTAGSEPTPKAVISDASLSNQVSSPVHPDPVVQLPPPPDDASPGPTVASLPTEQPAVTDLSPSEEIKPAAPSEAAAIGTPPKSTNRWGGYIYSLVVPQLGERAPSRPASVRAGRESPRPPLEVVADPHAEQAPAPEATLSVDVAPALSIDPPTPLPEPLSDGRAPEGTARTHAETNLPVPALTQASWLTYLTSRAAQKTITSGASLTSSRKPRRRSDATEEVMDMSNDVDFPSATPNASITSSRPKNKSESRQGRLSITSKTSANGTTAPTPTGRVDGPATPAASASSLPQPAGPVVAPNFVVPTFDATFNRPPRSLPPVLHAAHDPAQSPGSGITANAASLAWKAWGTASNYVYGAAATSQPAKVDNDSERRGKKEGREVGGNLPRALREPQGQESWRNVKRVVVFGVHGWFPAKMLNSLIGEPTGTSTKFANMMAQAVKSFLAERGVTDIRLTVIPLEGEGTIESRVDKLYKAYLSSPSYINDTRRADAIFFAAHSQGCIVTTHLISRLIAQGHIRTANNADAVARCDWAFGPVGIMPPDPRKARLGGLFNGEEEGDGRQKVAMLAMCGVHLGPFYSLNSSTVIQPYLQWFENNAARELFDFQDTLSPVSQAYHKALAMILDNEVKVLLLSSLNDQVVPIYSSSFSTATHPLLLRALYVDGASHSTSDFMTKLITFALMLRNAGIDDEGLVGHLSEATAGGLTGIGHSTPYESPACYTLAVEYLFCSGPAQLPLPPLEVESFTARDAKNDFELPWILRALTDAAAVKDLFPDELRDLKEGVVNWKPITKALKDIKKRLEPMAGKQSRLRSLNHSASSASLNSHGGKEALGTSPAGSKALSAGLRRDW